MTSPAVVILTDPARCQLADADTLVKALLELQQLKQAGVPMSQAFCDHPAAAREFVDAYSKVYPELQQQSSDLPSPEDLYSMVAEGRFGPIAPPASGEPTRSDEAAQLYPLYVLSLGAPEALMQALQHYSVASSSIRVLEIAPIEEARTEAVSIAEAVAQEPVARSSWRKERSDEPDRDAADASPAEGLQESETVKLASLEINLDHIQVDENDGRRRRDQKDPAFDGVEPGHGDAASARRQTGDDGPRRSSHADGEAPSAKGSASSDAQPASASATGLKSSPETQDSKADEPVVIADPEPADPAPPDDEEPAGGADDPPDDQDPPTDDSAPEGNPPPSAMPDDEASLADLDPAAALDPAASRPCSFAGPDGDVRYPPAGDLAWDDDLPYSLPADLVPDIVDVTNFFEVATRADVVDLEALYSEVRGSVDASVKSVKSFDLSLTQGFRSGGPDSDDFSTSRPLPQEASPRGHEAPDTTQDEAHDQALITVHDTDL